MLTQKLAYPLLLLMIGINVYVYTRYGRNDKRRLTQMLRWLLLFMLVYLLLLPLGGFREYRPYILRKDTFLPVALVLVYFFAFSSYVIIRKLQFTYKPYYLGLLAIFLCVFTFSDEPDSKAYQCERVLLMEISTQKEPIVRLPATCTVLSWEILQNPDDSEEQGQLLYFWKITDEQQRFYQE